MTSALITNSNWAVDPHCGYRGELNPESKKIAVTSKSERPVPVNNSTFARDRPGAEYNEGFSYKNWKRGKIVRL